MDLVGNLSISFRDGKKLENPNAFWIRIFDLQISLTYPTNHPKYSIQPFILISSQLFLKLSCWDLFFPRILDLLDDNQEELEEVKNRFKPSHTFVQNTEAEMSFFLLGLVNRKTTVLVWVLVWFEFSLFGFGLGFVLLCLFVYWPLKRWNHLLHVTMMSFIGTCCIHVTMIRCCCFDTISHSKMIWGDES